MYPIPNGQYVWVDNDLTFIEGVFRRYHSGGETINVSGLTTIESGATLDWATNNGSDKSLNLGMVTITGGTLTLDTAATHNITGIRVVSGTVN